MIATTEARARVAEALGVTPDELDEDARLLGITEEVYRAGAEWLGPLLFCGTEQNGDIGVWFSPDGTFAAEGEQCLVSGDTATEALGRLAALASSASPPSLNDYAAECRAAADRWYYDPATGDRLVMNKGERLMLIVSELSEAMEGERKGLMDDKLPHRRMAEVELVDALIRIFDYAGEEGYDLEGAYREKLAFNATRPDHSHAGRLAAGGKKW